jgi:hypothetical protein
LPRDGGGGQPGGGSSTEIEAGVNAGIAAAGATTEERVTMKRERSDHLLDLFGLFAKCF